ncbi:hypothetical protein LY90DRAFT_701653 [Neocallimastix californiae]|uniref:Endonuclease/exonuclease/phosphatase domain-containing protein n=1 Tax=Neocallimastix californiae TaxID=1754190 RepID=A0A1Y2DDZ0_9FUNG|nr:hypothetical protein LY90DRAFT_701653 [Neocallimastix californiae]|eukprot:ORY57336.1 hypothetical protein LY90DRAFT_701653 [Neocallimastix californiae]
MSISNSLKEFTLSTLNTYLIPSYWTKFKTNPVGRALKISEFYNKHQPDIIMLQEVWGVGIPEINSKLKENYSTIFDNRKDLKKPLLNTAFNTVLNFVTQTGGLYYAQKPDIKLLWTDRETYNISATHSQKGIRSHLYSMDEFFRNSTKIIDETPNANESSEEDISSKYLLVFNTHLDAFDNKNKIIQLQQARKYIEKTLYQTVPDILKLQIEASQKIGKPELGVILVGDWNIPAHHQLYKSHLLKLLGEDTEPMVDFYTHHYDMEDDKDHTYDVKNSLVTVKWAKGRIDYIFGLNSLNKKLVEQSEEDNNREFNYKLVPLKCLKYDIIRQERGEEMTDHWPIIAKFSF